MIRDGKTEIDIKKKFRDEVKYYPITDNNDKSNYILHLTSKLKKNILINNISGVDIDENAVEITRFSLSMKALDDSTREELYEDVDLFNERILPTLDRNIKCGNSLIENDFYFGELFETSVYKKVNDFNWKAEYSTVINNGGFDCVIGNPPYLRIQGLQDNYAIQIDYFIKKYKSAVKRFDLYLLFLEKGFSLLNDNGVLGFINPHKFTNSDFGSGIRMFLNDNKALSKVISFGNNLIFTQASTYTGLFFLNKNKKDSFLYYEIPDTPSEAIQLKLFDLTNNDFSKIYFESLGADPWILSDDNTNNILQKLNKYKNTAKDIFLYISQGIVSTGDDIFYLLGKPIGEYFIGYSDRLQKEVKLELKIMQPILKGEDVKKYIKPKKSYFVIYPHYVDNNNKTKSYEENVFKKQYPLTYEYLKQFKKELTAKKIKYKTNPQHWYSLHRSREIQLFETNKIITPEISLGCNMTLDTDNTYHNTQVYSLIPKTDYNENINYWLGLLNSNLFWWYLTNTGTVLRGGYFRFKTKYIEPFPLPTIDFNNSNSKSEHDKIVDLVTQRMQFQIEMDNCMKETDRKMFKKRISAIEKQLNDSVYSLYELKTDEIEEIEKASVNVT